MRFGGVSIKYQVRNGVTMLREILTFSILLNCSMAIADDVEIAAEQFEEMRKTVLADREILKRWCGDYPAGNWLSYTKGPASFGPVVGGSSGGREVVYRICNASGKGAAIVRIGPSEDFNLPIRTCLDVIGGGTIEVFSHPSDPKVSFTYGYYCRIPH